MSDASSAENEVVKNNALAMEETTIQTDFGLASSKLKEYFELYFLQQEHPEFKEDIQSQIALLSESAFVNKMDMSVISVESIRPLGTIEKQGDSIQKIPLYFDVIFENETITDSIIAILRTQIITIERQEVMATKVTFEKFKMQ